MTVSIPWLERVWHWPQFKNCTPRRHNFRWRDRLLFRKYLLWWSVWPVAIQMICSCLILRNLLCYVHGSNNSRFIVTQRNNDENGNMNGVWGKGAKWNFYVFVASHFIAKMPADFSTYACHSFTKMYMFQCTWAPTSKEKYLCIVPHRAIWFLAL